LLHAECGILSLYSYAYIVPVIGVIVHVQRLLLRVKVTTDSSSFQKVDVLCESKYM